MVNEGVTFARVAEAESTKTPFWKYLNVTPSYVRVNVSVGKYALSGRTSVLFFVTL